ncbi:hypothetical protein GXM_01056 [Nostoc sphaeroides CCNUC1]|uniref:Uncharacterized protein n=1 Tax=Nostoc sphaeroides CCNUC1 TaxID=2653204 RepID=A0A5P8VT62_9NOSO|nr:hypothetical protein GXM_01056 [Nostoc sphaeroides CCNUC1]
MGYQQSLGNELVSCVVLILTRLYFAKPPLFHNEFIRFGCFFIQNYV